MSVVSPSNGVVVNGRPNIAGNGLQLMAGGNKRLVCGRLTLGAVMFRWRKVKY